MSDSIGRRGEAAISTILGRPVDGKIIFDSKFLGAKNQTFDFSVSLLGEKDSDLGPFFLLQVKATMISNQSEAFEVSFHDGHVDKSRKSKVPTYIVAIDVSKKTVEDAYFIAIDHSREGGIWTVPRLHNFGCDETLLLLYNEVYDYFANELSSFSSSRFV